MIEPLRNYVRRTIDEKLKKMKNKKNVIIYLGYMEFCAMNETKKDPMYYACCQVIEVHRKHHLNIVNNSNL